MIGTIRVVLFDDADAKHIPGKLSRYHRFHADRDFTSTVRWLDGTFSDGTDAILSTHRTSIPHNLPALQPFFGREDELRKIAEGLDPESRTWGALIDGPGGMGKTSLAIRAAYEVSPDTFDKIVFVSLKPRELDDDGVRDLSGFVISGLAELLNELARELGHADIAKAVDDQRPRLLLDALPAKNGSISTRTLRTRLRQHYELNTEGSTLRLTLGCLLAERLGIELRRVGSGKRMTFWAGEQVLSE